MPRNTFIFVVILTAFAALVAAVNLFSKNNQVAIIPAPTLAPTPTPQVATREYVSQDCGVAFTYPATLTVMESATRSAIFVNQEKPTESIVLTCQKEIPRPPLIAEKIETVQIGSISAKLYHDASAKDGTPIDKLIFFNPKTKLDVFLAGYGEIFNSVISSLKILTF